METKENESSPETQVTVRIFSPNLSPEEVTKNLGLTPDHAHNLGDYPRDNPKYSAYKHGMWSLRSNAPKDRSLEEHLESVISILEPKKSYIQELARNATVDFYCVLYSQSGFQLSPEILKRIGELGITFGIILYD